ncbi:hypothetical protein MTO96_044078 [Rhipicephalus appendiculatus]
MSGGADDATSRFQQFLGAMHGLRDALYENWPSSQATVAIVVLVTVLCAFVYGLLRDAETAALVYTPDAPSAYFRVASRSSDLERREPGYVELEALLRTPIVVAQTPPTEMSENPTCCWLEAPLRTPVVMVETPTPS